ncbi:metal ABC transporter substrate-binding protein [Paenibacillus eucommiae]|uniref:Zinc transport system substrate-binding protein n=1 Tax=Paenibacillus eucommiae TaxID=1355755 RepID=A0ABS4IY50_9BACL|nr:metal ABC transporter substrate-binding protein [Paenibacillus eucommiae]MBP1992512.1 zinc transport system substrate-binding protein [Paenibacillus eucommiae]
MKSWLKHSFILAVTSSLILSGCGNSAKTDNSGAESDPGSKKIKIAATFYPMAEFSRQVAGEHAEVITLVPAGVEPHDWEPSPKDMTVIKEADVFVYNGGVEGWVDKALESAANDKRIVVETIHDLELIEGEEHSHEGEEAGHEDEHAHEGEEAGHADEDVHEHGLDPHVWLSPVLAQKQVAAIQAALEKADPAHKEDYKKNADIYIAKLKELDELFKSGLNGAKRKDFVTQHAAFAYLAKEYGLTQVPISGISPEQEPSPSQMAEVIKFAKEHDVKTIFFETLVDPKIAQTIAKEVGAKTDVLNPIEGLTEEDQKENLDYIGVMKKNLEALKKALNE